MKNAVYTVAAIAGLMLICLSLAGADGASQMIQPHPIPADGRPSPVYRLTVNDLDVPVVDWYGPYAYAHMSYAGEGPLSVVITVPEPIVRNRVRPLREQLEAKVEGNRLAFTMDKRAYLDVTINGYARLFLFIDPAESFSPRPSDPEVVDIAAFLTDLNTDGEVTAAINRAVEQVASDPHASVLYFGPGVYRSGTIILRSGVTVYLAPGALLKASDDPRVFHRDHPGGPYRRLNFITAYNAENVAIRGRGVIDGNAQFLRPRLARQLPAKSVQMHARDSHNRAGQTIRIDANRIVNVQFSRCRNVIVEGVISRNSSSWNTVVHHCDDSRFSFYKVLSDMIWKAYKNDDAIDLCSVVNVTVENSFFLARDDGITLKSLGVVQGLSPAPDGTVRDMHDVLIRNNVIFSETAGLKYGQNESSGNTVHRIVFENNVVLQAREAVQIDHPGNARVFDLAFIGNHYENITEIDGRSGSNYILRHRDLRRLRFINEWHESVVPGENVIVAEGVEFINLMMGGRLVRRAQDGNFSIKGSVQFVAQE